MLKNHTVFFDLLIVTLVYTISNALMVFNTGVYWDDWVIHNMDKVNIVDMFKRAGSMGSAYIHPLISGRGATTCRFVVFISYLLSAWCFFAVLKELSIDRYSRLFAVLFFALFPVNSARNAMITVLASVYYALFFCGFWLTLIYLKKRIFWYRVAALMLFFVSFQINSLLVFYLIIILCIMYWERLVLLSISDWLRLIPRYADYVLLPIIFWLVKRIYMKPYGLYSGYNVITSDNLQNALADTFCAFNTSFLAVIDKAIGRDVFSPLYQLLASINFWLPFALTAVVIALLLVGKKFFRKLDHEAYETIGLFFFGAFVFYLGAFPYLVVGKMPQLGDWASRFQLLVPLGASLLLVYGVKLLCRHRAFTLPIYLFLMIIFIHATISYKIAFQRDWYKQLSIMENIQKAPVFVYNTSFLFRDDTRGLNYNGRVYRFYEYSGLMKKVFENERHFGVELQQYVGTFKSMDSLKKFLSPSYNLGDFARKEPEVTIVISRGTTKTAPADVLKLMWLERTDKEKFIRLVSDVVKFEVL